jgi:ATP-binding cassette, subfamily C, bacterial CydC
VSVPSDPRRGAATADVGRRLLGLLAPYRRSVGLAVLLGFGTLGAGIGLMATAAYLISKASLVTAFADVAVAVTAVRALALSRAALRYAERYVTHLAALRILTGLRVWFFAAVEPLAPARLRAHRSGDLLARIGADVETLDGFFVRGVVPPLTAALAAVLAALLLGRFDPALGVALLFFLALGGAAFPLATRRLARAPAGRLIATRAALHTALADEIQGLAELLAFGQEEGFRSRVRAWSARLGRTERHLARLRGAGDGLGALLAALAGVAVMGLAIPLVTAGRIEGVFLALLPLTAIASFEGVQPLAGAMQQREASYAAAGRLFEVVDAPPVVRDPPEPSPTPTAYGVELRGVRFRYGPGEPLVLDGFDLAVPAGGRVALVGPSGAGKSTVVNLLLRFWEPEAGQIRVGGLDVRACRAADVRDLLGVVPQQPYLFHGTVRDNLLLARGDATDDELVAAARRAQLHELVAALPRGYDTPVGENGLRLSGGERQRLALARVILKGAPIVVLDEATANLDAQTEERVVRALDDFLAGRADPTRAAGPRTAVIISHRPALLGLASRVVTLDGGPHSRFPACPAGGG